jgi:peptidoglycan/LPS O-acetylase OafA/YrhL
LTSVLNPNESFSAIINNYALSAINDYKSYLKGKLKFILPNYFIWGFLISFFDLFQIYLNSNQLSEFTDILSLFINTFLRVLTGNVQIVYFSFILIQFYIIFPLILKRINRSDKPILIYILSILGLFGFVIFSMFFLDIIAVSQLNFVIKFKQSPNIPIFYLAYSPISITFLLYFLFFMLGIICANYKKNLEKISRNNRNIILLVLLYVLLFLTIRFTDNDTYFYLFLDGIAISLIVFIAFLAFSRIKDSQNIINKIDNSPKDTLERNGEKLSFSKMKSGIEISCWKLGLNSAGIYYTHRFIVFFVKLALNLIFSGLSINFSQNFNLIINVITFVISLIIAYFVIDRIRKYVKKSRYIIGI